MHCVSIRDYPLLQVLADARDIDNARRNHLPVVFPDQGLEKDVAPVCRRLRGACRGLVGGTGKAPFCFNARSPLGKPLIAQDLILSGRQFPLPLLEVLLQLLLQLGLLLFLEGHRSYRSLAGLVIEGVQNRLFLGLGHHLGHFGEALVLPGQLAGEFLAVAIGHPLLAGHLAHILAFDGPAAVLGGTVFGLLRRPGFFADGGHPGLDPLCGLVDPG